MASKASGASERNSSRKRSLPQKDWDKMKTRFEELYITQRRTIKACAAILKEEYQIDATHDQFVNQAQRWGFFKYKTRKNSPSRSPNSETVAQNELREQLSPSQRSDAPVWSHVGNSSPPEAQAPDPVQNELLVAHMAYSMPHNLPEISGPGNPEDNFAFFNTQLASPLNGEEFEPQRAPAEATSTLVTPHYPYSHNGDDYAWDNTLAQEQGTSFASPILHIPNEEGCDPRSLQANIETWPGSEPIGRNLQLPSYYNYEDTDRQPPH